MIRTSYRLAIAAGALSFLIFAPASRAQSAPASTAAPAAAAPPAATAPAAPGPAPAGYAPPPAGYGAPPPGYPPGYGAPPPGYYGPPPGYPPPYYYAAPPPERPMRRRSVGLMVTGIVLTGLGAVGVLGGAAVFGTASKRCSPYEVSYTGNCEDEDQQAVGGVMMLTGLVLAAAGIPLLIVGAKKVPDVPESSSLRVVVGGRSAGLRYAF